MKFLDLLFPPRCMGCGELLPKSRQNIGICYDCSSKWEFAKINAMNEEHGYGVKHLQNNIADFEKFGTVLYAAKYNPEQRQNIENVLLIKLKKQGDRRCVNFVAGEISDLIKSYIPLITGGGALHKDTIITWIPRSKEAIGKYGFDHMELVSKRVAKKLSISSKQLIKRKFISKEQKKLSADERKINAQNTMKIPDRLSLDGKTILLLDDIVTTGASIEAASKLLISHGASQVIAVAFCSTERKIEI